MYAAELGSREHLRTICKACSDERKKETEPCLSVDRKGDYVVWFCHHCGDKGSAPLREWKASKQQSRPVFKVEVTGGVDSEGKEYLFARGLTEPTIVAANLFSSRRSFRDGEQSSIGFPTIIEGKVVGVKYRGLNKDFMQEAGSEQALWGQNLLPEKMVGIPLVITEGEIDALTCVEVGIAAVSVPGGAPLKVSDGKIDPSEDRKFSFVWAAKKLLDSSDKIILATDADEPGVALREELARRIGKSRCWIVKYPEDCKDLNDVLRLHGADSVRAAVAGAEAYPIHGLFTADSYFSGVDDLYTKGEGKGLSTGFSNVDTVYTVVPGQMTVVTGWPSHGKSNYVDQTCVNLAKKHDWRFLMASFENPPEAHIVKLCEIFLNKPFFDGPTPRMTLEEMRLARQWVSDHFLFLDVATGDTQLESILARAQAAVGRIGIRGFVIDPYNYIDLGQADATEAKMINDMLTRVNTFAKTNGVHVWFVAHPAKMQRMGSELPIPDGMSISGSMAWWAKCDVGLTVHREADDVMLKCWKMRWRWVGKLGKVFLGYDVPSGTYFELPEATVAFDDVLPFLSDARSETAIGGV